MASEIPETKISTEVRFQAFGRLTREMVFPSLAQAIDRGEAIEEAPRLTVHHMLIVEPTYRIIHP